MSHIGTLHATLTFTGVTSGDLPAFEATIDFGVDAWRSALPYPISHGPLDWSESASKVVMEFTITDVPCAGVASVIASFDAGIATFPPPYIASREGFTFNEIF